MSAQARVIAYGEGSHGVHEFLAVRNQLFAFLVQHQGVTALIAETHPTDAAKADAYIQGAGELSDELVESVFTANRRFRWRDGPFTENRQLLEWMRHYNQHTPPHERLHFYGIDTRHPLKVNSTTSHEASSMANYVLRYLEALPENKKLFVFAHNGHLRSDSPQEAVAATPGLGQTLRHTLGTDFFVIGSAYATGQVRDGGNRTGQIPPPEQDSVDYRLAETPADCAIINLHHPDARSWLATTSTLRGRYWNGSAYYLDLNIGQAFDALLFQRKVTPVQ